MRMLSYVPHLLLMVRFLHQSRILCCLDYTRNMQKNQALLAARTDGVLRFPAFS